MSDTITVTLELARRPLENALRHEDGANIPINVERELLERALDSEDPASQGEEREPGSKADAAKGINAHGVLMCECGNKRPHAWEPGEWCGDRVIPAPDSNQKGRS